MGSLDIQMPRNIPCTSEVLDSSGIYLLDDGSKLWLYIGRYCQCDNNLVTVYLVLLVYLCFLTMYTIYNQFLPNQRTLYRNIPIGNIEELFDISISELRNSASRPLTELSFRGGDPSASCERMRAIVAHLRNNRVNIPGLLVIRIWHVIYFIVYSKYYLKTACTIQSMHFWHYSI